MKVSRVGAGIASKERRASWRGEPFGALDAQTRGKLRDEVLQIWEQQRTTVLFVTHSIDEALLLADRILVFSPRPGRIAADIKVDLPRPRASQSAEFSALARELRGLVGADREID
jgi:NitT/TauT family transport system ATP-binding protein